MTDFTEGFQRAERYRLLSECFYPPGESLLRIVRTQAILPDFTVAATMLAIEDLRKDHARLFVGPFENLAPPYGSVYMEEEPCVYGDSTQAVSRLYEEEGLEVALKEPPDHVAIELEYMYLLAFNEAKASIENRLDDAVRCRWKQADFLGTHLGKWFPAFAQRVLQHAETAFYRQFIEVAQTHIEQERERLFVAEELHA